jgi:hypothetical protein
MEHYEQIDDNKYTVGIAASLCLASLPVISVLHQLWTPRFVAALSPLFPCS